MGKETVEDVDAMMVHPVWDPMEFWFIVNVVPLEDAVVLMTELKFELVRMSPDEMDDEAPVTLLDPAVTLAVIFLQFTKTKVALGPR